MVAISAIVIARNEEATIGRCLASLGWAREIVVVVDARTDDATAAAARRFTDKVFVREWDGYVRQKRYAIEHTASEWILWIDADEVVPAALAREIGGLPESTEIAGFCLPRRHLFVGRWLRFGGAYPDYQIRLFRKSAAQFDGAAVHETVAVAGPVSKLQHPLDHYSTPTISSRVAKVNAYSSLEAPDSATLYELIVEPLRRFWSIYVRRQGFRDGTAGYLWAVFCALETLCLLAKGWKRQQERPR